MSVILPITAEKISSTEVLNQNTAKYSSLEKGVDAINRMRNVWKIVAMKTWKEEDRPDLDTSFSPATGNSPVVNTQTQLRCDFPYDLESPTNIKILIELYVPINTTGVIEIVAIWDDGIDASWFASGSYTESDTSAHYKLLELTGIVYPRGNTVLAADEKDPGWLNIYAKTWAPDGGVVDIPQFSAVSILMNPIVSMTPDLYAGGKPLHRDLCVDIPGMLDNFTERNWLEMVDVAQNMITVLNHSPECSLDLVKNYNGATNPGYVQNVNDVKRTLGGDWAEVLFPCEERNIGNNIRVYISFYLVNTTDMTTILEWADENSNSWTGVDTLTGTTGWRQHFASVPIASYSNLKFRIRIKLTTGTTNVAVALHAFGARYFYDDVLTTRA